VGDWEAGSGGHAGGIIFEELRQIVQSRIEISLKPLHHLVSIIVPALDEERTVEHVLRELVQLDLSSLGISKEILVVDGGSTDRTVELAKQIRGVKVLAGAGRIGRGEALRRGIAQARGGQILFYPSDGEYSVDDIPQILSQLLSGRFEAVFGTRNIMVADLKSHLNALYAESVGLSLLSRYGGMLISILALLLYGRYVTDTLSSLKAFDAGVLRGLALKCSGVDLDTEIVAKLSRQRRFILEVPVQFKARRRAEGKKMGVTDGLRALLALIRFRVSV
jgi:glycosyltransferase involved in cell wall biosynthesis